MVIFNKYGIKVYTCELPETTPSRGPERLSAERNAVNQLLREAFPNDPTIAISHHDSGAPFLCRLSEGLTSQPTDDNELPAISISHCKQMAAIAIAPKDIRIGIDCEHNSRTQTLQRVSERYLSPEQASQWQEFPQSLRAWCIKEAAYKAALHPGLPLTDIPLPNSFPTENPSAETAISLYGYNYNIIKIATQVNAVSLILIFAR